MNFRFYTDAKEFKTNHKSANDGTLGFYDWQEDYVGVCLPHLWKSVTNGVDEKTLKYYIPDLDLEEKFIDRVSQNIQHEELHRAMWQTLGVEKSQKLTFPHTYHELTVRRMLGEYNEMHLINYMATDLSVKFGFPLFKEVLYRDFTIMRLKLIALLFYTFAMYGILGIAERMWLPLRVAIGIMFTYYLFAEVKILNNPFKKKKKKGGKDE